MQSTEHKATAFSPFSLSLSVCVCVHVMGRIVPPAFY